jgi:NRPS condensation-like uncharacterized protein
MASRLGTEMTIPFSVIDEAIHLLDVGTAPWSIQLEARVNGSLDEARLRRAIGQALTHHPMARAAKLPSHLRARLDNWVITHDAALDPLRVVDCPDDEALEAIRAELQGISVPLTESPPLRAVLARSGHGDVLMLNVNHAAMDGFGAMAVMRSIAAAYRGAPEPAPKMDFLPARNLTVQLEARPFSIRLRRQLELATRARDLFAPPARVASEGADDEAGYGFVHSCLSEVETEALVRTRGGSQKTKRAPRATVNDVLLAALHLAIDDWNAQHDAPCRRIGVLVPANLRPSEWREEVASNFTLPARIATSRRNRRTPAAALKAVAAQTNRKKKAGMGTAFITLLGQTRLLPLWAKRLMVLGLPLTGNRLVDTAMLSNLGHLHDPPSFGDGGEEGQMEELWFSPPARMPLGLTIGVATLSGRMFLVLRYRHRLFDPAAATRFADLYLKKLEAFTGGVSIEITDPDQRRAKRLRAA